VEQAVNFGLTLLIGLLAAAGAAWFGGSWMTRRLRERLEDVEKERDKLDEQVGELCEKMEVLEALKEAGDELEWQRKLDDFSAALPVFDRWHQRGWWHHDL
jgi:hypothetical protein